MQGKGTASPSREPALSMKKGQGSLISVWLVGLLVVIGAAVALAAFVPIVPCPECPKESGKPHRRPPGILTSCGMSPCSRCGEFEAFEGRVTLMNFWFHRDRRPSSKGCEESGPASP